MPYVTIKALRHTHNKLWAFLTLTSTCSLQVSQESRTTPRYLTDIERRKVTPKKHGSKKSGSILLLVGTTGPVFFGINHQPDLDALHLWFMVWDPIPYLGISPPIEDKCHPHSLGYIFQPNWALLSNHQQSTIGVVTKHLPVVTPTCRNVFGRSTESCHSHAGLQNSCNPPYNGVVNPMFKKTSTYGVIGGVIKWPFYV